MKKRDLYSELVEGLDAVAEHRQGNIILNTHRLPLKAEAVLAPEALKTMRENLQLSQAVFARYLQTGLTTYQNWEQERAKPNKQGILLIRLIDSDPATPDTQTRLG